ncbi:hypothetical protein VTK73DRAFT_4751 [Phialemonium thermophilum]|uniref:Uncharacterized protein n=1 Tax=Phialemonium thermophilum TaxID=223376 RepID=A0ABR3WRS3_9PEZI
MTRRRNVVEDDTVIHSRTLGHPPFYLASIRFTNVLPNCDILRVAGKQMKCWSITSNSNEEAIKNVPASRPPTEKKNGD